MTILKRSACPWCLLAVAVLSVGCAGPRRLAKQRLDEAGLAVAQARGAGAPAFAKREFSEAETAYSGAQTLFDETIYGDAAKLAQTASEKARRAAEDASARLEALKERKQARSAGRKKASASAAGSRRAKTDNAPPFQSAALQR